MKTLGVVLVILLCALVGCSMVADMYPATIPSSMVDYLDIEPDQVGYPSVGKAARFKEAAITKHIVTQLDLESAMKKDEVTYEHALERTTFNISKARQEFKETIGTLDNPGWLLGLALGGTGLASYVTGLRTQRAGDRNPCEHEADLEAARARERAAMMAETVIAKAVKVLSPTEPTA